MTLLEASYFGLSFCCVPTTWYISRCWLFTAWWRFFFRCKSGQWVPHISLLSALSTLPSAHFLLQNIVWNHARMPPLPRPNTLLLHVTVEYGYLHHFGPSKINARIRLMQISSAANKYPYSTVYAKACGLVRTVQTQKQTFTLGIIL